jgi:hypothetical protein
MAKYAARGWSFDNHSSGEVARRGAAAAAQVHARARLGARRQRGRRVCPVRLRIPPAGRLRRECSALRHDCCAGDRRRRARRGARLARQVVLCCPLAVAAPHNDRIHRRQGPKSFIWGSLVRSGESFGREFGREQRERGGRRERPHGCNTGCSFASLSLFVLAREKACPLRGPGGGSSSKQSQPAPPPTDLT